MESYVEKSFKKKIKPFLDGLIIEEGFSSHGYEVDYIIRNRSGYPTHLFEIKESLPPGGLSKMNQRYRAFFQFKGQEHEVACILAIYNNGNWQFYRGRDQVSVEELFLGASDDKTDQKLLSFKNPGICYSIAIFFGVLSLIAMFLPLSPCIDTILLSSEIIILLCVGGFFAILPSIYPRIKEIRVGSFYLVLIPEE